MIVDGTYAYVADYSRRVYVMDVSNPAAGTYSAGSVGGFVVSAAPALGQKLGILIYGDQGQAAIPFEGGLLCVQSPRRTLPIRSGGTSGLCDGVFSLDLVAFANGLPGGDPDPLLLSVGTVVDLQWWGRDTQGTGVLLSNGLEFTVEP